MIRFNVHSFDLLESTQDTVKDYLPIKDAYPLVIATQQSKSRGQRGKTWESPKGNLYFSFAMPVSLFKRPSDLCFVVGLAMVEAISADRLRLKWPNDLFIHDSKVGGILVEQEGDVLIAGVGVNVAFVPEILSPDYSICCLREVGYERPPSVLLHAFISAFQTLFALYKSNSDAIFKAWQEKALWRGESVCLITDSDRICGVFDQISPEGGLVIEGKTYYSGSLRPVLSSESSEK